MKACPFCAEEIQDAAIVCKHCNRDLPQAAPLVALTEPLVTTTPPGNKTKVWPWVVGGILLLIILGNLAPSSTSNQLSDPAKRQALEDIETKMESIGLVKRVDLGMHNVQVDPMMWQLMNADQKSTLALNLAAYCAMKSDSPNLLYADIIDSQSGRKLAEYGAHGFSVP